MRNHHPATPTSGHQVVAVDLPRPEMGDPGECSMNRVLRGRAVLVDLDGTLVDSTASVDRCWVHIATRLNLDPAEVLGRFHGMPAWMALKVVDPTLDHATVMGANEEMLRLQIEDTDDVVALPGALRLLETLPADVCAIVTSCSTDLTIARLNAAGLPVPPLMVTADHVTTGKPDPEPYLLGAGLCREPAARCIVIEDAPAGVAAAQAAGCAVLGLRTTHPTLGIASAATLEDVRVRSGLRGWWELSWDDAAIDGDRATQPREPLTEPRTASTPGSTTDSGPRITTHPRAPR